MVPVAGVFLSLSSTERTIKALRSRGVSEKKIVLLTPGGKNSGPVPESDTEQPGMGKAMGGVIGAAFGAGTGLGLGAAVASMIPGVGPVMVAGYIGAAILGLAGAEVGATAGHIGDENLTQGLPADELFVYEDALRRGRSVIVALADDDDSAESIRKLMQAEGAESVDAARKEWWIGLRSAEKEHYTGLGKNFDQDENFYRMGFEAAMHAKTRCKQYDQTLSEMDEDLAELKQRYPNSNVEEPFRRGFERGRDYYQGLCNRAAA